MLLGLLRKPDQWLHPASAGLAKLDDHNGCV